MRLFTYLFICVAVAVPSVVFSQSASYELTTDVNSDGSITVYWETDSPDITDHWIGLYRTNTINSSYLRWQYTGQKSGSLNFNITKPGDYEFRYFSNNIYNLVAKSEVFSIENTDDQTDPEDDTEDENEDENGEEDEDEDEDDPSDSSKYELTVNKSTVRTGEKITVSWNETSTSRDWIGLYKTNSTANRYLQWIYVGTNDSLDFTITQPGTYEFRQYINNSYTKVATSEEITVTSSEEDPTNPNDDDTNDLGYSLTPNKTEYARGDVARVTWSVPSGKSFFLNWIGLYRPGASDQQYLDFEYVDFLSYTETFELDTDGTFEFRFFANNSYDKVATSQKIVVDNDSSSTCNLNTSNITNFPTKTGPIIAFGDSVTFGVGASNGEDYVSELEDRLDVDIMNKGVPGDTTLDALSRLDRDVLRHDPSAVIVFLGGNDEIRRLYETLSDSLAERNLQDDLDNLANDIGYDWMNVPLIPRSETFANLETIIDRIQDTGAVTIVVGFDTVIYDSRIDDNYRQIALDTGSFYVSDIYDDIFGRSRFMSDLVHPNDAGYDIVADRIQPAVACVI